MNGQLIQKVAELDDVWMSGIKLVSMSAEEEIERKNQFIACPVWVFWHNYG